MPKSWKKIFVFQFIAMIIAVSSAWGQTMSAAKASVVTGMTTENYAIKYDMTINGKSAKELFKDKDNVFCGSIDSPCSRATHVCWRCRANDYRLLQGEAHDEEGYCLRGTYESTAQQAYNKCQSFKSRYVGGRFNVHVYWDSDLLRAPNGFLREKVTHWAWVFSSDNEEERTFTGKGADGKEHKYVLAYDNFEPTLKYADEDTAVEGCEVLPIKLNKMSVCFFCPLIGAMFTTADKATELSFDKFGTAFRNLMMVAFAVWLAFASLNIVYTFTKQDASKYITGLLKQGGKFLFAYFLLLYPTELFSLFIEPVLKTGLEMGSAILPFPKEDVNLLDSNISDVGGKYFSSGLYVTIIRFLEDVQRQLAVLQAIGTTLFCIGGNEISIKGLFNIEGTVRNLMSDFILGTILFIFGILLTVAFVFYFLDAILQLCVLGPMVPMMIAGWPFKVTAKYATEGLKMLLNSTFTMFFTGFVISVEVKLIDEALGFAASDGSSNAAKGMDDIHDSVSGIEGIFQAINIQDTDDIRKYTNIGAKGFLLVGFSAIFGFKFVSQITKMSNKLAGGLNLGIGPKVGTMLASTAKGVALKASKPMRDAMSEKWHAGGGLIGRVAKVGKAPGAIIKGGNWVAHKFGAKNTLVDRFQTNMENRANSLAQQARDAKLEGGFINRIKSRFLSGMANRAKATAEHGFVGGLASRVEDKAKQMHNAYMANEKYNDARQKQEAALRRKRGESDE